MQGLNGPPAVDPSGRLFEYDLDDLAEVGVRLPEEQVHLLEQCIDGPPSYAMTVTPLTDPEDRYRMTLPLVAWDVVEEEPRLILYPRIVEIDWSEMLDQELFRNTLAREFNWRRFPSLPGRARDFTSWGDYETGAYESFRIWDLWPLSEDLVDRLEAPLERWFESESYVMLRYYYEIDRGDFELCDFASFMGEGDEDAHSHVRETVHQNYTFERCLTGERRFDELERKVNVKAEGQQWVRWFPGPRFPAAIQQMWEALLLSSHRNSMRAMRAIPPWNRDDILRSERAYSAWLWLC